MNDASLTVELKADLEKLSSGLKGGLSMIRDFANQSNSILSGTKASFDQVGAGATNANKNIQNLGNNSKRSLGGLNTDLLALSASFISVGASIKYAFQQNIAVDSIKTSLTYLLGSSDEMETRYARLKEKANAYGLEVTSLGQAYQLFIGSAKAANQDLGVAEKVFYSLSKAGAVLHLSQEKVASALYAVQQMMDKGTVQSEELRRQLGNSLPGAMAIMAQAAANMQGKVSMSNDELMGMMKSGKLISSEVLPFFAEQIEKTFGIESVEKVESLQASVGRLKNALTDLATEDKPIGKLFQTIADGATDAIKQIDKLITSKSWQEFVARLISPSTRLPDLIRGVVGASDESGKAVKKSYGTDLSGMGKTALGAEYSKAAAAINAMVKPYNDAIKAINEGIYGDNDPHVKKIKQDFNLLQAKLGQIKLLMKGLPDDSPDKPGKTPNKATGKGNSSSTPTKGGLSSEQKDQLESQKKFEQLKLDAAKFAADMNLSMVNAGISERVLAYDRELEVERSHNSEMEAAYEEGDRITAEMFAERDKAFSEGVEKIAGIKDEISNTTLEFGQIVNQFVNEIVFTFLDGLGQMMAGGDFTPKDFGKSMLKVIAGFIGEIGKLAIKQGSLHFALGLAKNVIAPGSGVKDMVGGSMMIAAGAGALVAGGFLKGKSNSSSKNSDYSGSPLKTYRGFANGGNNISGGMAWVGERGPELMHVPNGANITPNHQLNGLMGSGMGSGMDMKNFKLSTSISMGRLHVELEREKRKAERMG